MRRITVPAVLVLLLGAGFDRTGVAQATPTPRLLVVVVVDQLRTDYLSTFGARWRGGLHRLRTEGADFTRAEYPYMNTVTCAGHATIGTGTFPRTHGMILNGWWDRTARASRECTEDPGTVQVGYGPERKPADAAGPDTKPPPGDSAKDLLVPTLGDALRARQSDARIVTLSLKARSAIGLAGHGGAAVTWVEDGLETFATSSAYAAGPVPAVARFIDRHPFQDDAGQTWTLRDPAASYLYPDATLGARPQLLRRGLFPHRIAGVKDTDPPFFTLWQVSPYSDAYLARMALALVDAFRLGQRGATDFLGVSFSALDLVGHSFGPESREVEDLLRRLDDTLGALFTALDEKVGRNNWVLALSSDHGVAPIAVTPGSGRIVTQDVGDRIEETLLLRYGPRADGAYVDAVVFNNVYFAPGVYDRLRGDPAAYREMERGVLDVPGMDRILRADLLSVDSGDEVIRQAALSHRPDRSGDLVLVGKPNWYFSPRGDGSATTHGTGHPYDRRVPVMLLGAGITPGRFTQPATPADIAPTLAHLADVPLPTAEGRVLREAIGQPGSAR